MKPSHLYIFFLLSLIGCSTTEEVDIKLNPPKLVINSLFSPDNTWQVSITNTVNIVDDPKYYHFFPPITTALVTLYDQSNNPLETLNFSHNTRSYHGTTVPEYGEQYTLQVKVNNENSLQAISTVPQQVPIISVEVDSSSFKSQGEDIEMNVTFKDPAQVENYYLIKIVRYSYDVRNRDTVRSIQNVYYEPVDPAFQNDFFNGNGSLINDRLFDGKTFSFRLKTRTYYYGSTTMVNLVLLAISKEYYEYFTSQSLQQSSGDDPFAQPAIVYSNFENGVGIFAGYSSSIIRID